MQGRALEREGKTKEGITEESVMENRWGKGLEGAIPLFGIPNRADLLPGELGKGFMEKNEGSWWKRRRLGTGTVQFGASQCRKTMEILEGAQ